MQLDQDSIAEFQRLYEEHSGVRLSESEARTEAALLISLVEVVYYLDEMSTAVAGFDKKDPSDGTPPVTHQIRHLRQKEPGVGGPPGAVD